MPRSSIEYLNERREHLHSTSGGKNYARVDRVRNASDLHIEAQLEADHQAGLDLADKLAEDVTAVFAEFRSWAANQLPIALVAELAKANDNEIPF